MKELARNGSTVVALLCSEASSPHLDVARTLALIAANMKAFEEGYVYSWKSPVTASLALLYQAGYAALHTDKLSATDYGSELWLSIAEANQDCGFAEEGLRGKYGFRPYCSGFYTSYSTFCGRVCIATVYFVNGILTMQDSMERSGDDEKCAEVKQQAMSVATHSSASV